MQKREQRKIKSALKNFSYGIIVVAILLICSVVVIRANGAQTICLNKKDSKKCDYRLVVADSEKKRVLGLSDRASIKLDKGMIFIFDYPSENCLWMKDMKFSLDMLWLNENKEIINIKKEVSPATYPKAFCAAKPAKYAIELSSGSAQQSKYIPGDVLNF